MQRETEAETEGEFFFFFFLTEPGHGIARTPSGVLQDLFSAVATDCYDR